MFCFVRLQNTVVDIARAVGMKLSTICPAWAGINGRVHEIVDTISHTHRDVCICDSNLSFENRLDSHVFYKPF